MSRKGQKACRPGSAVSAGYAIPESMVVVETCRGEEIGCPNLLIRVSDWKLALDRWAAETGVSRKLRQRLGQAKPRFHDLLHVSISGCPNGCSRPQIADVGITGWVRPELDPAECRSCGACSESCPDRAICMDSGLPLFDRIACQGCKKCEQVCPAECIALSDPAARVMLGGRLGRRPRLATPAARVERPQDLIMILDALLKSYLENAGPEERMADHFDRIKAPAADNKNFQ